MSQNKTISVATLSYTRGFIGLVGELIDSIQSHYASFLNEVDGLSKLSSPAHVTIISKQDLLGLSSDVQLQVLKHVRRLEIDSESIIPVGLGKTKVTESSQTVYFVVIIWKEGQDLRHMFDLGPKDFHITLASTSGDLHGVDKGITRLVYNQPSPSLNHAFKLLNYLQTETPSSESLGLLKFLEQHVDTVPEVKLKLYDLLAHTSLKLKLSFDETRLYALQLFHCGSHLKGYIRLGDCLFASKYFTIAALAYFEARALNNPPSDAINTYLQSRLRLCVSKAGNVWSDLIPEAEYLILQSLDTYLPLREMRQVNDVFSLLKEWFIPEEKSVEPRDRFILRHSKLPLVKLPRFFSWVVHGLLAGMSEPRNSQDIEALKQLGISSIITLTEERRLPLEWFSQTGLRNWHFDITNYKAPTSPSPVDFFIQLVLQAAYKSHENESISDAVLVHCGGGKGRAGTFLACYLMRFGLRYPPQVCKSCYDKARSNDELLRTCSLSSCPLSAKTLAMSPQEAIILLRRIRPGSIETKEQEQFVVSYGNVLWKRFSEPAIPVPVTQLKIEGVLPSTKPVIVICVGLPGSGKSWFSKRWAEELGYLRVSQDELGSKSACDAAISNAVKRGVPVIVDKCNPSPEHRASILSLCHFPKTAICIYFSASVDICKARVESRLFHPTLEIRLPESSSSNTRASRIDTAIEGMKKLMIVPKLNEKFAAICHVGSFGASLDLLGRFGVQVDRDQLKENYLNEPDKSLFHKFPRTQHLMNLGSVSRDDLLLSKADAQVFLNPPTNKFVLTLEEKVDGANIGISINDKFEFIVQNRGHYVNSTTHTQFKALDTWLSEHSADLYQILLPDESTRPRQYILFGEWLAAKHSILYSRLPNRFMAFDIYDTEEKKFFSRRRFLHELSHTRIPAVRQLTEYSIPLTEEAILELVQTKSRFYDGPIEGVYFRLDYGDWLSQRAKVVRPDFLTTTDFWAKGIIEWNSLAW